MNTPRPPHAKALREAPDWLAQEAALSRSSDPRDALLARALRTQPRSGPPADLADATVRHVQAQLREAARDDARLERALLNGLLTLLAMSALGAVALYGAQWWAWAAQALGSDGVQWAALGAACLGLSAGLRAALSLVRTGVPQAAG